MSFDVQLAIRGICSIDIIISILPIIFVHLSIHFRSVREMQLFSAPRRPTLASEVPIETSLPREGPDYIFKAE